MYQPGKYTPPQSPIHADYAPPGPPRHAPPGTRDAKSKAGHIAISVLATIGALWIYQNLDGTWRLLTLPLALGAMWPFLPMLADWFIVWQLRKAGSVYNFAHDALIRALINSDADYSSKHYNTARRNQDVTLRKAQEQERLEAENDALRRRVRETTQPIGPLPAYTADMRRLVDLGLSNDARIVSERRALAAGMSQRAFLAARQELIRAGIVYQAENGYFYLNDLFTDHDQVTQRLAA
jgi:hypothetical protein